MLTLKRNLSGQRIFFFAADYGTGAGVTGIGWNGYRYDSTGASTALTGAFTEHVGGLYSYMPSAADLDTETFAFTFDVASGPTHATIVIAGSTIPVLADGSVLSATQAHYTVAKPGDAMTLAPGQDVRDVLGTVHGITPVLDAANGLAPGLTIRQGFLQLIAALVNVSVTFAHSEHVGPTHGKIVPKYTAKVRQQLAAAISALLAIAEVNSSNPDLGLLSPGLATAVQQLSTALDAVRTTSA